LVYPLVRCTLPNGLQRYDAQYAFCKRISVIKMKVCASIGPHMYGNLPAAHYFCTSSLEVKHGHKPKPYIQIPGTTQWQK
jgi:hypothetical protein